MCLDECFGDQYLGCDHFVRHHYTGKSIDCMSPTCGLSKAHACQGACRCSKIVFDQRIVLTTHPGSCLDCEDHARENVRDMDGDNLRKRFLRGEFGNFQNFKPRNY